MQRKLALTISVEEPKPKRTANVEGTRIIIGSRADADVHVDDPRVAPEHAAIESNDAGELTLVDLGSEAGTFIHGERITRRKLEPGDRIEVGSTELELLSAEPVLKPESGSYREAPQGETVAPSPAAEPVALAKANPLDLLARWWPVLGFVGFSTAYLVKYGVSLPSSITASTLAVSWPPSPLALLSVVLGFALASGDSLARDEGGARTTLGRLLLVLAALVAAPVALQLGFFLLTAGSVVFGVLTALFTVILGIVGVVRWILRGKT